MGDYTLDQAAQEAAALSAMLQSPGWKILTDHAEKRKATALNALMRAKAEDVSSLQATALAWTFVLEEPKQMLRSLVRATETPPQSDGDSK